MSAPIQFRIVRRSDGYHVLSEEGKNLGGPYKTEDEAKKRLAEVEAHKAESASAVGSALHAPAPVGEKKSMRGIYVYARPCAFVRRAASGMSVPVDVWDQLAKIGEFERDGPVVFDADTLATALKNFARRKNKLSMDFEHQALNAPVNGQPAPSLARYNAMALVIGGKVVAFDNSKDPSVAPPTPEQCRNPDTGEIVDGLYIHRCFVTPLGEQLLPNYEHISPAFTTDGKDEQGNPIGLDFVNLAATDVPFLDGLKPIEMTRFGSLEAPKPNPTPKRSAMAMDPSLMKRYALAEGYSEDDLHAAMAKFAEDSDTSMKKMSDELEKARKKFADIDDVMKRMSDGDGDEDDTKKMDPIDGDGAKKMRAELKAIASDLKCGASLKSLRGALAAMKFTHAPKDELHALKKELAEVKAERAAEKEAALDTEIKSYAQQMIDKHRLLPEDKDGWLAFAKFNRLEAEKLIKPDGYFLATKRFTKDGKPSGASDATVDLTIDEDSDAVGVELQRRAAELVKKNPKLTLMTAIEIVYKEHPELYRGAASARR